MSSRIRVVRRKRRNWKAILGPIVVVLVVIAYAWFWDNARAPAHRRYDNLIIDTAARYNLDPYLVKAVIRQESNFDADARGKAGEYGLMQITEGAARDWERGARRSFGSKGSLFRPKLNLEIGCWYLAQALRRWRDHGEREVLILAQYNAGPSRAATWAEKFKGKNILESIPFDSTRKYIDSVLAHRKRFTQEQQLSDGTQEP